MPKLLNMILLLLGGLVASASFSVVDEHSGAWLPAGLGLGLVVEKHGLGSTFELKQKNRGQSTLFRCKRWKVVGGVIISFRSSR